MREIKFRGKRKSDDDLFYGDLVTETNVNFEVQRAFIHVRLSEISFTEDSLTSRMVIHEVEPESVGQYTGLKDGEGQEIYEGDIAIHDGKSGSLVSKPYGIPIKYGNGEIFIFSNIKCGLVARHISSFGDSMYDIPNCIIKGWEAIDAYQLWNLQRGFKIIGNIYENADILAEVTQ